MKVAVKSLKKLKSSKKSDTEIQDKMIQAFAKESMLNAQMRHPNIVQFFGAAYRRHVDQDVELDGSLSTSMSGGDSAIERGRNEMHMVFEFCNVGSLDVVLKKKRRAGTIVPWEERVGYIEDIAAGIEYMHSHGVIHRDLKSGNILLHQRSTGQIVCKLADLGFAKIIEPHLLDNSADTKHHTTAIGTIPYLPPEIMKTVMKGDRDGAYSFPLDIFALGCLIFEIVTMTRMWEGDRHGKLTPI